MHHSLQDLVCTFSVKLFAIWNSKQVSPWLCICCSWNFLEVSSIMLEISAIMLALCFMLSSPYYAYNYADIIDLSLLLSVSNGESYCHQFSWISIMLLRVVQWNPCIMNTLEPFTSVLIILFSIHGKAPFVTITKCEDYASVLIFKCLDKHVSLYIYMELNDGDKGWSWTSWSPCLK